VLSTVLAVRALDREEETSREREFVGILSLAYDGWTSPFIRALLAYAERVHYGTSFMFGVLMWLNRRPHRRGLAWALFLIMLGIERFLVEIVRAKDDRLFGEFTVAQVISVLLVVAGAVLALRRPREMTTASPTRRTG
jgi:hypothetical protein